MGPGGGLHHVVVVVVADERSACSPFLVTGSALQVVGVNKDDDDDKDEPSCWNEADNFAETKS